MCPKIRSLRLEYNDLRIWIIGIILFRELPSDRRDCERSKLRMNTNEETTINDRIGQIIYHYKLNNSSLGKRIGLNSGGTITNIVSGRKSKPSYDILRKIAEVFPVNTDWLLLGKGPMLRDNEDDTENNKMEMDKIVEMILESPEEFEKNKAFASYIERKCDKAIIAHYDNLMKSAMSDIDLSSIKPKTKKD